MSARRPKALLPDGASARDPRASGEGESAKAIAGELGIRLATVRNHISAVLCEPGAHSQLEAVARARERALL